MKVQRLLNRISPNPEVMVGKPVQEIYIDLKRKERKSGRGFVTFEPRRVESKEDKGPSLM